MKSLYTNILLGLVSFIFYSQTLVATPSGHAEDTVPARYVYSWEASANRTYFKTGDEACIARGAAVSGDKGQYTDTYSVPSGGQPLATAEGCNYHWKRVDNNTGVTTDEDPYLLFQGWFTTWVMCPEGYGYDTATGLCKLSRALSVKECGIGNPIYPGKGNKARFEVDYQGKNLSFSRQFASWNQGGNYSNGLGTNWFIKTYHRHLDVFTQDGTEYVYAVRKLSRKELFTKSGNTYSAPANINNSLEFDNSTRLFKYVDKKKLVNEFYTEDGKLKTIQKLSGQSINLTYSNAATPASVASVAGLLIKIEDDFGASLNLSYDVNNRLIKLIDPSGREYSYEYDGEQLVKVVYPDATSKSYHYKDILAGSLNEAVSEGYSIVTSATFDAEYDSSSLPPYHLSNERVAKPLSGITDENGVRFHTYDYDLQGRGISTELAGGVDKYEFEYNVAEYQTTVTNALGKSTEFIYQKTNNQLLVKKKKGNATPRCEATAEDTRYYATGYPNIVTDANGNKTKYFRNSRGLVTNEYQGYQSSESRSIRTYWHSDYDIPTKITYPNKQVVYEYDANLRLKRIEHTDLTTLEKRATSYTYNQFGQVLSIDAPLDHVNDSTALSYDSSGNLSSITNSLGQTTQFTLYDANGKLLSQVDPNGLNTQYVYDERGNLTKIDIGGRISLFAYDNAGQIVSTTLPSGNSIQYEYDDAHRLIAVQDSHLNRIEYTLDLMGNKTQTQIKDSSGLLTQTATRIYDELSRLNTSSGANSQEEDLSYDRNNNLLSTVNSLDNSFTNSYDALNRLIKSIDPDNGETEYGYNSQDHLTSVLDAEGKTTSYEYNAFGEVTKITSPDTGVTEFTYDKAGNVLTKTDARNETTTYTYDALNRVLTQSYSDTAENIVYSYDDTANGNKGIGRLTSVTDQSGTTSYFYNGFGQVTKETRVVDGKTYITEYHFDANGQMTGMTYPGGRQVNYTFDSLNRISGMTTTQNSVTATLASNIDYLPFGPMKSVSYGNGKALAQDFDLDYRLTDKTTSGIHQVSYGYDVTNNITNITDSLDNTKSQTFTYDKLSRLLSADGGYGSLGFTYDKIGNRLSKTDNGNVGTYTYASDAHRLLNITGSNANTFTHDAIGNTLTKGDLTFIYNKQGRLKSASKTGMNAEYVYNFQGQRVSKQVDGVTVHFVYDLNGQLIAEADSTGAITKEYAYLNGQRLSVFENGSTYFVHTDHLGTPIALSDSTGTVQWKAHYTPFGKAIVEVNNLTQNIRFPGQYFDAESGLHYNYFRDYDPEIGRYIQSDPIGLNGGINTYGYVGGNPVNAIDPNGLELIVVGQGGPSGRIFRMAAETYNKENCDCNEIVDVDSGQDIIDAIESYSKKHGGIDGFHYFGHSSNASLYANQGSGSSSLYASSFFVGPTQLDYGAALLSSINPAYFKNAKNVKLWGCNAGYGKNSIGEQLAKLLGVSVEAAVGPTNISGIPNGLPGEGFADPTNIPANYSGNVYLTPEYQNRGFRKFP